MAQANHYHMGRAEWPWFHYELCYAFLQRRAVERLVNHGHFRWHCRVARRADHVRSGYDQHLCFGGIGL